MDDRTDVAFFGTADFAVPILAALAKSSWRPSLVITTPDEPAGRGKRLAASPVKEAARRIGLPIVAPERLKPIPPELRAPRDLFIVAAYGKILSADLLAVPRRGALNIHPSLLPRWRGAAPIQATIAAGDAEAGITIIAMDAQMDHGPIVRRESIDIPNARVTAPELSQLLAERAAAMLLETIPAWLGGAIAPIEQDHAAATFTKPLRREDGRIDWSRPAAAIERMIRAYQPWPGAFTFWQRGAERVRLSIESASAVSASDAHVPGAVIPFSDGVGVATGDGILVPIQIRPAGSRSMPMRDFLNGHADFIGAHLG